MQMEWLLCAIWVARNAFCNMKIEGGIIKGRGNDEVGEFEINGTVKGKAV